MSTTELSAAPTGEDEFEQAAPATEGKLFEMPAITVDESNPTAIKVAVSGEIALDRSQKSDADFYNGLTPGKLVTLEVQFFVKGPKTTHRRDSDGNVDAVMQTKSLVVDGVTYEAA